MKKILTLSIITFISIFMIGTTLVTAGGVPFEALQRQIDDLQQQIDNLQNITIKAFATTTGISSQIHHNLAPETDVDLLTLELPAGKYLSTITIQAHYLPHDSSTNLSCGYVISDPDQFIGFMFGGNVSGQVSHAHTMGMHLWEPAVAEPLTVTVRCHHTPVIGDSQLLDINHAEWTVIAVDELDDQISEPALSNP